MKSPTIQKSVQKINERELVDQLYNDAARPADAAWVFDCDGTLIQGDIASLTAWGLIRTGLAQPEHLPAEWEEFSKLPFDYDAFRRLRRIIIDQRGATSIYEWESFLHAGLPPSSSYDIAKMVIREGEKMGVLTFENPLSDLAKHFAHNTWIVSGSPDICVAAIAEELAIPRARVLGTMLETVDGVYAARIAPPGVIWEDLKRQILLQHKVAQPWFVAGDTIGDWQMLEIATRYAWCAVWGAQRHRGDEFREAIQTRVLGVDGPRLPSEPGFYTFQKDAVTWIFEIKTLRAIPPTPDLLPPTDANTLHGILQSATPEKSPATTGEKA